MRSGPRALIVLMLDRASNTPVSEIEMFSSFTVGRWTGGNVAFVSSSTVDCSQKYELKRVDFDPLSVMVSLLSIKGG